MRRLKSEVLRPNCLPAGRQVKCEVFRTSQFAFKISDFTYHIFSLKPINEYLKHLSNPELIRDGAKILDFINEIYPFSYKDSLYL